MIDLLSKAGLNKYEGEAYKALLSHESMTAYEVAKHSRVPLSRVYEVLNSLVDKGFIKVTLTKPKKFIALKPKVALSNSFSDKLDSLKRDQELVMDYFNDFKPVVQKELVKIYEMKEPRIKAFKSKMIDAEQYYYSIFKNPPINNLEVIETIKAKLASGVDIKGVIILTDKNQAQAKKWLELFPDNYRVTTKNQQTRIGLRDDALVHICMPENHRTIIHINDKDLCLFMKQSFNQLWTKSKRQV